LGLANLVTVVAIYLLPAAAHSELRLSESAFGLTFGQRDNAGLTPERRTAELCGDDAFQAHEAFTNRGEHTRWNRANAGS
jgi:hypothetical protein